MAAELSHGKPAFAGGWFMAFGPAVLEMLEAGPGGGIIWAGRAADAATASVAAVTAGAKTGVPRAGLGRTTRLPSKRPVSSRTRSSPIVKVVK